LGLDVLVVLHVHRVALECFLLERHQVIQANSTVGVSRLLSPHGVTGLPVTLFDF